MERRQLESIHSVPHYHVLVKTEQYRWIDDYLISLELRAEYKKLYLREKELKKLLPALDDFKQRVESSYDVHRFRRIERVKRYLEKAQHSRDPFSRLEKLDQDSYLTIYVPWVEVETAFELLAEEQAKRIPDTERQAELQDIANQKEKIKIELDKVMLPGYFLLKDGRVVEDGRESHVNFWIRIKQFTKGACDSRGMDLKYCEPFVAEAYRKLDMSSFESRKATFLPAVPHGME